MERINKPKPILDACCGGKMFYFNKEDDRVLFQDIRDFNTTPVKPIFGHISGKRANTHWICFMK